MHIILYDFRCNGSYRLTFVGTASPKQVSFKRKTYKFYAYIDGITSDNLSYINQASDSANVINHSNRSVSADVCRQWHTRRLVAAFTVDCQSQFRNKSMVSVIFNLKESYFKDLENSVHALSPTVISRIMPTLKSFGQMAMPSDDLKDVKHYCSEEQVIALRKIVTSPPNGPPVLLAGAFGTGKSRLLALSVRYFQSKSNPVRALVCTQQRVSADKFLEYYMETWVDKNRGKVFVIREYGFKQIDRRYEEFYVTSKEFEKVYKKHNNVLIITTCLTAPHLSFIEHDYFTHIIIDEGSQMREPEAVAPLYLAAANTQIIIAGDQNQVHNMFFEVVQQFGVLKSCML